MNQEQIIINGQPFTYHEIEEKIKSGDAAKRILEEIIDEFYGKNLSVYGWHMNGAFEPMDVFFEHNNWIPT